MLCFLVVYAGCGPKFDRLVKELDHKDPNVRIKAARALGEMRDARAVQPLIVALTDDVVRETAKQSLMAIGEPSLQPLIAALQNENWVIRENVAEVLGRTRDPRIVDPLNSVLRSDNNRNVRAAAIDALGVMGEVTVLGLIDALKDIDADIRAKVVAILGTIKDLRSLPALSVVLKKDKSKSVQIAATAALEGMGGEAILPLIDALRDKEAEIRTRVAEILGKKKDRRAVPALIFATRDKVSQVQEAAARALGEIGDKRSVDRLNAMMDDYEEEREVRIAAADALDALKDVGVRVPITEVRRWHMEGGCTMMSAGRCRFVGECGGPGIRRWF